LPSQEDVIGALAAAHEHVLGHVDNITREAMQELKEHRHFSSDLVSCINQHHTSTQDKLDLLLKRPPASGAVPSTAQRSSLPMYPRTSRERSTVSVWLSMMRSAHRDMPPWRKRLASIVLGLILLAVLIGSILAGVLARRQQTSPFFWVVHAQAVTTVTTPASPGTIGLDVTLQLDNAAHVYYVVYGAEDESSPADIQAADVVQAAGSQYTSLTASAVACGDLQVPQGSRNFTVSIVDGLDTSECVEYSAMFRGDLDHWAEAMQCLRCPALQSLTTYKVRGAASNTTCPSMAANAFRLWCSQ
jgi:hypothetical protein